MSQSATTHINVRPSSSLKASGDDGLHELGLSPSMALGLGNLTEPQSYDPGFDQDLLTQELEGRMQERGLM